MNKMKKTFDAIAMMRRIRDQLSARIEGMTLEEELDWLATQDLKDPFLELLRRKAAQHGVAPDARSVATRPARVPAARKERSRRRG